MKNKKLLGILGITALLLAGNFAIKEAKEVDAANERTIYLNAGGSGLWDQAGAVFYGHFWGERDEDVKFTDSNGDGVYEAKITSNATDVIFTRCQPSSTSVWDKEWNRNQTKVPADKNCYTITGWGSSDGSWSNYTPPSSYTAQKLTVVGSMQGWDVASKDYMTDANEDHVYDFSLTLEPGVHSFKIVKDNSWTTNYGYTALTKEGVELTNDADDNCVLTSLGGTYSFEFDYINKKLKVEQTSNYTINQVMNYYYNEGTYSKETVLNVDSTKKAVTDDLRSYFHAGAQVRYRKTEYKPGELTMVTKANETDDWGTATSTYKDKGSDTGVDHYKGETKDYSVSGTVNGENRNSIENWFVTLCDFKDSTATGWTYDSGVYSIDLLGDAAMTKMAREFVAPMWLATAKASSYFVFTKLTVQSVNGAMVMKLWVAQGDSEKLVSDAEKDASNNYVFSQATITK